MNIRFRKLITVLVALSMMLMPNIYAIADSTETPTTVVEEEPTPEPSAFPEETPAPTEEVPAEETPSPTEEAPAEETPAPTEEVVLSITASNVEVRGTATTTIQFSNNPNQGNASDGYGLGLNYYTYQIISGGVGQGGPGGEVGVYPTGPSDSKTITFDVGTTVRLKAYPLSGYTFNQWWKDVDNHTVSPNPFDITLTNAAFNAQALFFGPSPTSTPTPSPSPSPTPSPSPSPTPSPSPSPTPSPSPSPTPSPSPSPTPTPTPLGSITVYKHIEGERSPLEGAQFRFEVFDGNQYVTVATGSTAANGEYTWTNLPAGTYRLTETSAPNGYILDVSPRNIELEVGEDHRESVANIALGALVVSKYISNTEVLLGGATFELMGPFPSTDTHAAIGGTEGVHVWRGLTPGTYTLTETGVPTGYTVQESGIYRILISTGETTSKDVSNDPIPGTLVITKLRSDRETPIDGAEFELMGPFPSTDTIPAVKGATGIHGWRNLAPGTYILTETTVPEGFTTSTTEYKVIVNPGDTLTRNIYNDPKPVTIVAMKFDILTGLPLEGSVFELSFAQPPANNPSSPESAGIFITTATTNAQGIATFGPELNLRDGVDYWIREITPPSGYQNDPATVTGYPVTISEPGGSNSGSPLAFNNTPLPGSFTLYKYDVDFPSLGLPNAVFTLQGTSTGITDQLFNLTTDANGEASVPSLHPGTYLLTETSAPTNGGSQYTIEQATYTVTIYPETNTNQDVANRIVTGSLVVAKFVSGTIDRIGGVKFALYEGSVSTANKVGPDKITDINGNVSWGDLRSGSYIVVEVSSIPGYIFPTDTTTNAVVQSGIRTEVVVYNDPVPTPTPPTTTPNTPESTPEPTPTPIPDDELIIEDEDPAFGPETGEGDELYLGAGLLLFLGLALLLFRKKVAIKR